MAGQRKSGQTGERSKQEVRAERILDAAGELIERWGYNKTTIDDIARQAGVAKGTIYLHWKTREDLFWALLLREDVRLAEDIRQRIAADPEGGTLHGMVKHMVLATLKSPLAKAMLLMDSTMLGEFARRDYSRSSYYSRMEGFRSFFALLQEQGAIRDDIDIKEQVHMLSAIATGYLMIDQWMPEDYRYSDEELADMTAESIQRTLEPRDAEQDREKKQVISHAFTAYLDDAIEVIKREDQDEEARS